MNSIICEFHSSLRRGKRFKWSHRAADTDLMSSATNVKLEQMRLYEFLNRGSNQGFQQEILITRRIKTGTKRGYRINHREEM